MSWRETLGVAPSSSYPYTHNSQNAQNPIESSNCADIADSAYRDPEQENSRLLEALAGACCGLSVNPVEVRSVLAPKDIEDWQNGDVSDETLATFAASVVQRREMERGIRPAGYTEHATCRQCGPIWLWTPGEVLGCPWCWNRTAGKPIPRPTSVRCGDCIQFERYDHPNLGHCAKGEPENLAGLWDSDLRTCRYWTPTGGKSRTQRDDQ